MVEEKPMPYFFGEVVGRIILASFYLGMFWASTQLYLQVRQPALLLYIVLQGFVAVCVLFRRMPVRLSLSPVDWAVALLPTIMPYILPSDASVDMIGRVVQYLGTGILIGAVVSINTSFGIVPADRGIKTKGLFKLVRHPFFLGYIIANIGILISNYSVPTLILVGAGAALQVMRLLREEALLIQNPAYKEYKTRVRWRLLPYIW